MIKATRSKRETKVAGAKDTPTIEVRVAPDPRGPAVCLHCRQPFEQGESWKRGHYRRFLHAFDSRHG